jgi:hypothetical protein
MNRLAGTSVVLLRWPDEVAELDQLRAKRIPRLLMVPEGEHPPVDGDPRSDWIRMPIADEELWTRLRTLELRAGGIDDAPALTDDGRLTCGDKWVAVSPIGERILRRLIEAFSTVVPTEELLACGWPDTAPDRPLLRVHMAKLRTLLAPLGLRIVSVRDRGYVLHWTPVTVSET